MTLKEQIKENCLGCNRCTKDCALLKEAGPVKQLISHDISFEVASSCMMCGLCEKVCPQHLSPRKLFVKEREHYLHGKENTILSTSSPDRENPIFKEYRQFYHIDYSPYEIKKDEIVESVFFPGCLDNCFIPKSTIETFKYLFYNNICQKMWNGCCSEPLITYCLNEREKEHNNHLLQFALKHGIKRVVTPCTNCYFSLTTAFQGSDIEVISLYDILDIGIKNDGQIYTFHDSCSDRIHNHNIFANGMRRLLKNADFHCVEMEHHKNTSLCCGTGGGALHYRPQYESIYVDKRIEEAKAVNADVIVTFCPNCGMQLLNNPYGIKVKHILQIVFGIENELEDSLYKKQHLFDGADGKKRQKKLKESPIINSIKSI